MLQYLIPLRTMTYEFHKLTSNKLLAVFYIEGNGITSARIAQFNIISIPKNCVTLMDKIVERLFLLRLSFLVSLISPTAKLVTNSLKESHCSLDYSQISK